MSLAVVLQNEEILAILEAAQEKFHDWKNLFYLFIELKYVRISCLYNLRVDMNCLPSSMTPCNATVQQLAVALLNHIFKASDA